MSTENTSQPNASASAHGSAPGRIWLQWDGDQEPDYHSEHSGVTWAEHQVFKHDVEYVRAHEIDRLRAAIEEALMHLDTNYCIDGHSMKDSDAANALRRVLPNNNGEQRPQIIMETKTENAAGQSALANGSALPTGLDEHIDWKTQHDKRQDLFQSDERGGLHFPCNACRHASKPVSYCRPCKHYAI